MWAGDTWHFISRQMIVAGFSLGNFTRWALLAAINNRTIWPRSRSRPGKEVEGSQMKEQIPRIDPLFICRWLSTRGPPSLLIVSGSVNPKTKLAIPGRDLCEDVGQRGNESKVPRISGASRQCVWLGQHIEVAGCN